MPPQIDAKVAPLPIDSTPSDPPAARLIIRDPTYYLDDGSTTPLIDNTLFKLLVGNPYVSTTGKSTSDADPLIISTLSVRQFRHLLLALLGGPGDPLYMALLTDAKNRCRHTQEVFIRYLDVGNLANRLQMWKLAGWAQLRLELLLKSTSRLIENPWDEETVLQIATFAKSPDKDFSTQLHVFLRRILATTDASGNHTPHTSIIGICASFYGNPEVLTISQELFGWAFLLALSLGHRSAAWSTKLARENRLILYAAQAKLVKLSEYAPLGVSWLIQFRHPVNGLCHLCCVPCSAQCDKTWDTTFGKVKELQSAMPLDDVRQLIQLPREKCGEKILQTMDMRIDKMCRSMSEIHEDLVNIAQWVGIQL